jgi:polysaccharide biosynthesis protein PslA
MRRANERAMRVDVARNEAQRSQPEWRLSEWSAEEVLKHRSRLPNSVRSRRRVGTGGHVHHNSPTLYYELLLKRCFDVAVASVLLVLLAPGLVLIAIAIRVTSSGPILFRQSRYGFESRPFEILKFRTMYLDASDPSGVTQTRNGDPRVTRVGRLLRRSSLDELPQLWNVLRGDMSLVGPRPHVPGMLAGGKLYEELVPYYFERHRMRTGITGLAQVNGLRGSTIDPVVATARVDQDLEYIQHWSFALDIRILWQTFRREFLTGSAD